MAGSPGHGTFLCEGGTMASPSPGLCRSGSLVKAPGTLYRASHGDNTVEHHEKYGKSMKFMGLLRHICLHRADDM